MEQLELPYTVKLQIFEGPLDLLLHLIKKNEVDIYDIPIAKITDQYLSYLEFLKVVNLELVGSYLALAAELSYIKSRMLLPQIKDENEEEEVEDPRKELVKKLLEYELYRDVAENMGDMEILGREVFKRESDTREIFGNPLEETEYVKTEVWSLVDAFREIYERNKLSYKEDILFSIDMLSVEEKSNELLELLKSNKQIEFNKLFKDNKSRPQLIITFLSLLELVKNGFLKIVQNSPNDNINIYYIGE